MPVSTQEKSPTGRCSDLAGVRLWRSLARPPGPNVSRPIFVHNSFSAKPSRNARAFVSFAEAAPLLTFAQHCSEHPFIDEQGQSHQLVVEFAPYQVTPTPPARRDPLCGTLEEGEGDFQRFLATLSATDEQASGGRSGTTDDASLPAEEQIERILAMERERNPWKYDKKLIRPTALLDHLNGLEERARRRAKTASAKGRSSAIREPGPPSSGDGKGADKSDRGRKVKKPATAPLGPKKGKAREGPSSTAVAPSKSVPSVPLASPVLAGAAKSGGSVAPAPPAGGKKKKTKAKVEKSKGGPSPSSEAVASPAAAAPPPTLFKILNKPKADPETGERGDHQTIAPPAPRPEHQPQPTAKGKTVGGSAAPPSKHSPEVRISVRSDGAAATTSPGHHSRGGGGGAGAGAGSKSAANTTLRFSLKKKDASEAGKVVAAPTRPSPKPAIVSEKAVSAGSVIHFSSSSTANAPLARSSGAKASAIIYSKTPRDHPTGRPEQ